MCGGCENSRLSHRVYFRGESPQQLQHTHTHTHTHTHARTPYPKHQTYHQTLRVCLCGQKQSQGLHTQHTLDLTRLYIPPQADDFKAKLRLVKAMLRGAGCEGGMGAGKTKIPSSRDMAKLQCWLKVPGAAFPTLVLKNSSSRGAWVAQLVKRPTSVQVMISQFVGLSPALGSVLTAQSLEPTSDSVSPPLSTPPLLMLCVPLSLNNK